ncbi:Leucine-rich repeat [Arabidopsis thaliana x Arabidopsis arenosa]|uniref:Leucine-rich repeat n=1 Tax=Arabidopsis thaliana x Arabidopsis arenosa TaxID=1240361 RepID=A0A8T2A4Y0_9BRAS|nr:Leucine-rich repeat [Arabidopsis thaliana x Arabidopsis arenosa]
MDGSFPFKELKDLTNLELLDLSGNRFNGSMPGLKNFTNLEVLGLAETILDEGPIPIEVVCEMKNLRELDLRGNHFVGQLPICLGSLKNLRVLDLSSNQLSGNLPSSFSSLRSLQYLSLLDNNFTSLLSLNPLTNLTKLKVLKLSDMVQVETESTISSSSLNMPSLSSLDLSGNLFSGALPSHVNSSVLGKNLFLNDNNFTGPIPDTLLERVQILDLRNNKLSGSIPQFVNTQSIYILLLKGNNLTGSIPRQLCDMRNIRLLDLSYNKLNGFIPSCLYNLSFGLEGVGYTVDYSTAISATFFQSEFYKSTFVVEKFEASYSTFHEIEIKFATKQRYDSYIGKYGFNDGIVGYMYGMDLSSNELGGVIPVELGNLLKLRAMNLSHNFLSSSIPSSFSNLKDIESLDLSYNLLQGSIPYQITNLTSILPVRKHAVPVPSKYGSWTCIYCKKVTNGGVQRAKQHIVGGFRNVTQCSLVPCIVREEIKDFMLKKAEIKAITQMMPPPGTSYDDYDYEEEVEALASKRGQPPVKKCKGPMDRFVCPTPPDVLKGRKDNIKDIFGVCDKELRDRRNLGIEHVVLLRGPPLANMLFDHLDRMVEEVGEANVDQVVTDNASNYVKAGELLMAKRPHLYWTPCAPHCIDLILEDIGKIPQVKTVIKYCIFMNGYIYGHSSLVNMMRKFTNQGNLHIPAVTRFATSFITLAQYYRQRKNLRSFVNSQDWLYSKWPKEARARNVKRIILQDSFWHNVLYTLQLAVPLVKVLRLVDGEKKPAMGYIYEAMDRAKESIAGTFKGREEKYKEAFEIIDRRWNCHLHHPLHVAGYYLNPKFQYKAGAGVDCEEGQGSNQAPQRLASPCAIENGGLAMEGDSSNGNGTSENLEGCSTQYPMETSEGTQNEQVDDSTQMSRQKVQGKLHGCKSCIENERKALLELKNYMISRSVESVFGSVLPTWNNNKQSDCCRWKGIKCNHTSRRVIRLFFDDMYFNEQPLLNLSLLHPFEEVRSLNLSGLGYNGFFDDIEGYKSLRRLRNLEILDLSSNSFNNSIFPFLNTATSLTSLFLRWNVMGGAFPIKELKDLTNLELLDLRGNSFNSDMPGYKSLKRFKNLEILDLSSNRINQSIFPFLNTATSLKSLLLGWNFMYGAFPIIELKDLANLELLDLRGNSFNGSIPDLKNLTNLEALGLAENNPDGPIPIEVICEMKNLRELDLRANYIVGQLPLCLGSLKMLQVLDLSSNQLSGNLPSSFSNLESLEYLSLLDNNFTGLFSLNPLTNLTKLKVFKLSSTTDMVQVVTESNWQPKFQLSVVVLRLCSLEKIPSFLVYQYNLRLVDLSSNRLSGDIPTWLLVNNPELEVLQLQNNSFTFFQMPTIVHNLLVLDFSANNIGGLFPDNIGRQLPNLLHMNGSNNKFQGHFPSSMGEMKNLTFLDLSYNNLSGALPRSFVTGCFSLEYLKLSHNKFSGHILSRGTSFTSIVVLRMDNNLFTGKIGVGLLSSINTLQVLDMSNNCLTGAIPSWISKLPRSASLLLSNNFLEGTIPPSLLLMWLLDLSGNLLSGALPSQVNDTDFGRYLFLNNNNFTGPIPNTLLKSFEILDLRNNKLSGSIPQFVNTQSTSILLLRGNNLTGSIPRELCDLRRIRLLDLSGNKLNGFIPSCLFNLSFGLRGEEKKEGTSYFSILLNDILTKEFYKSKIVVEELVAYHFSFQEIEIKFASKQRYESYSGRSEFSNGILDFMNGMDLSNNELSGVIPEELGGLSKMQVLNLSHNFLSSSIPSSFSNLKDIESLDLSHNMLQGSIPHQLTSLTSLAVFDVSYNNLSGLIPQGRQFNTFNKESYLGNHLLCGPPTNRSCDAKKRSDEADNGRQEDEDESAVNMLIFYFSTASTYVTVLVGILILMCFDCSWRRAWLCIVDAFIASTKGMLP